MALRYWVGGAGNWSSTARWSTSSGGAGGASVPTSVDDVIFDALSGGKFIATVDAERIVNSITITPTATIGQLQIALSARLTTGNLTTTATAGNNRIYFRGNTFRIAQDFVITGTVSISDCDFGNIYVRRASGPISGTRIGNRGGCTNITFSAPKTVFYNGGAPQNWSGNVWAATSGGTASTDNFPLAQDIATFDNSSSVGGIVTLDTAFAYVPSVNSSTRTTTACNIAISNATTVYGSWTNGSGVTISGSSALTFVGGGAETGLQTITSAGKLFPSITIDSYGAIVELADALGTTALVVTNGTFDTKNYSVTCSFLSSSNTNIRTINLGSSTISLSSSSPVLFNVSKNLTLNAGTSQITCSSVSGVTFQGGGCTFNNVSFTATSVTVNHDINDANTFNNLIITASSSEGIKGLRFNSNQTITGTFTCAGATAMRRIFVYSNRIGTNRTLSVGTLSATDCDFRDITITGTASGSSPVRAGNCGGNSGINFPASKTVYWTSGGAQFWTNTGWATSSAGIPAVNNFPLAQDTAVFDNSFANGTSITMNIAYNIGNVDMSARTNTLAFITVVNIVTSVYGNWKFGTGVSCTSSAGRIAFVAKQNQTITSNGVAFNSHITFGGDGNDALGHGNATISLADAFTNLYSAAVITTTLNGGTFDAVSYNVTSFNFSSINTGNIRTIKMGSGTWTLTGTGTLGVSVWYMLSTNLVIYKDTANIVFSSGSTNERTFEGGGLSYNKFTVTTSAANAVSCNTNINGNNQFTELASTKTSSQSIRLSGTQTIGVWSITGVSNSSTVNFAGSATIFIIGSRVSGVDWLNLGTNIISTTSPCEFYAGPNSTGGTNVIRTAAPAATTRYWVGGTGTWDASTTTNWSASSGGPGGASVPTSVDAVIFNSASNATAYTVTCTATQLRCASLTMSGPASGNVTWAGTAALAIHNSMTLAATGITRTYTGIISLSGSSPSATITTNGVALGSSITLNGVNCTWSLGSALDIGTNLLLALSGGLNFGIYNFTCGSLNAGTLHSRTLNFGSSTTNLTVGAFTLGTTEAIRANLIVVPGTSQINISTQTATFSGNNQTFWNVSFTNTNSSTQTTFNGANTFNNLTFVGGNTGSQLKGIILSDNQTINGTLSFPEGVNASNRQFVRSDNIFITRTLNCAAFSGTDVDFRDISITGAAAPISGTRLGDCKGNTGITFPAAKTVYWNLNGFRTWSETGWATSAGGTPNVNNFPLAQDTAIFTSTSPLSGDTITVNAPFNLGTIDMSARTSNLMNFSIGAFSTFIYGNWINGTGITNQGTSTLTYAGRGSQTITGAGRTFTNPISINSLDGSVTLLDAFTTSSTNTFNIDAGTFNANGYNVTLTATSGAGFSSNFTGFARTINMGSGTWTTSGSGGWNMFGPDLTITGTCIINLTSASAKSFTGGDISYSGITLNQGGAGTLTITGNNTFKSITNTYSATGATSINIASTTQRLIEDWNATGSAGRILTLQGTSATAPGNLIFNNVGSGIKPGIDYLTITGIRAYPLNTTRYIGANSINNGSLGLTFSNDPSIVVLSNSNMFLMFM